MSKTSDTKALQNDISATRKIHSSESTELWIFYNFRISPANMESLSNRYLCFFNNHTRRSVNTCIISESCKNDRCFLACCKSIFLIVFLNTVDQWLSGFGNTTADNDGFRICHTCKHGKCSAKHFAHLCHNITGYFVALFKSVQNILC